MSLERGEGLEGKRKVKIYGGKAGYNSVSFTGARYYSLSRFKSGEVITETTLKGPERKITILLSKIPFVRSFSMIIDLIMGNWKRFVLALILLLLVEVLMMGRKSTFLIQPLPFNSLELLSGFLIIGSLIIKLSNVSSYHGAEHMVSNAFDRDSELTLEKVKMQPRTHKDCGTNMIISFFICYSILFYLFGDTVFVYLAAWMIGFELWRKEPPIIGDTISVIGRGVQYLLYTSKPTEKHLVVAMEAMKRLIEKEQANE